MGSAITSPDHLDLLIETAPAWALIGLSAPVQRLRNDARLELAQHVIARLSERMDEPCQLALPLASSRKRKPGLSNAP